MLFMRTILSLFLATFALAIPVAQPQALGDLGGVGLIGRADGDIFQSILSLFNSFLGPFVTSGVMDQKIFNVFFAQISEIVEPALVKSNISGPLGPDAVNAVIQQIGDNVNNNLGTLFVNTNLIPEDPVDKLLTGIEELVAGALTGFGGA